MSEFVYNSSKFQIERSLLQKAVRRGDLVVTELTVQYLLDQGDKTWLRDRLFVIAYEECWPIANQIQIKDLLFEYTRLASTVKNKNAWGLAKLASMHKDRNYFLDSTQTDDVNAGIIFISNALKDPDNYWVELGGFVGYDEQKYRVDAAKSALPRAKFPDDKAMMYAAGYLSVNEIIPEVKLVQPISNQNFPYWVAFDKHTEYGKWILQLVAEKLRLDPYDVRRMTFYQAGVICYQINHSPYYDMLVESKLRKLKDVLPRWPEVEAMIIEMTKEDAEKLEKRIKTRPAEPDNGQLSLF